MRQLPITTLLWNDLRAGDCGGLVRRIRNHASNEPHDHVFHEIVYVESGAVDHHTADGSQPLRPGNLIIIRPQIWHAYVNPRRLDIINCLIDRPLMQRLNPLLAQLDGAFDLFHRRLPRPRDTAPVVLHASPAQRQVCLQRLESVMAEQREKQNGWQAAATAALLDVLVIVSRLSRRNDLPATSTLPDRTEQAVLDIATHLEANFTRSLSLTELARSVGLSPAHLSRSFSQRMGMGIVQYLHRTRTEEACRLLRYTNDSIAHIAARIGYDEISYFSRRFHEQTGVAPRAYRRAWHADLTE